MIYTPLHNSTNFYNINELILNSGIIDCKILNEHFISHKFKYEESILKEDSGFINSEDNKVLDLVSNKKKIWITSSSSLYHFLTDVFISSVEWYKKHKDVHFLINMTQIKQAPNHIKAAQPMLDFLIEFYKYYNISYSIIDLNSVDYIKINNHMRFYPPDNNVIYANSFFDFLQPFIVNKNTNPDKKVYLSRKKLDTYNRDFSNADDHQDLISNMKRDDTMLPHLNDNRIYDEEELEIFFKNKGFEIVYPEDFLTIKDQINYMYSVKTLVSVTSSGIANLLFMKQESNIIEIITPLTLAKEYKNNKIVCLENQLHHFYVALSYIKNNIHILIPNQTRKTKDIVSKFYNNKIIKAIVDE